MSGEVSTVKNTFEFLCSQCSLPFVASRANAKYCSAVCRNKAKNRNRTGVRFVSTVESCHMCGGAFNKKAVNHMFCSESCKEKNRYYTHRETRIESSRKWENNNKDHVREMKRQRREKNPSLYRSRNREAYLKRRDRKLFTSKQYRKNNRHVVAVSRHNRRSSKKFKVTQKDLSRLLNRYQNKCHYCKVSLEDSRSGSRQALQWDHVFPLSKGGCHSIGNLVPSCSECNNRKSDRFSIVWALQLRDENSILRD